MNDDTKKDSNTRKDIDISQFLNSQYRRKQLSNKSGNDEITILDNQDDFLEEINSSLASQVDKAMEKSTVNTKYKTPKKGRFPKGLKIFTIIISFILVLSCLLIFTDGGNKIALKIAGKYIYGQFNYEDSDSITNTIDDKISSTIEKDDKQVSHIINILSQQPPLQVVVCY